MTSLLLQKKWKYYMEVTRLMKKTMIQILRAETIVTAVTMSHPVMIEHSQEGCFGRVPLLLGGLLY